MLEVWSKKSNIQIMGFQKREQRKLLYSWAHLKPLELCTCVLPTQLLPQSPLPLQLYKCMPITRASAVANLCATGISLFCWFQPLPLPLCLQLYPDILQVSATGVTHTTSFGHHCLSAHIPSCWTGRATEVSNNHCRHHGPFAGLHKDHMVGDVVDPCGLNQWGIHSWAQSCHMHLATCTTRPRVTAFSGMLPSTGEGLPSI